MRSMNNRYVIGYQMLEVTVRWKSTPREGGEMGMKVRGEVS